MPVSPAQTQTVTRVGVIGGGQLAWMMASAAQSLGISLGVQTPNPEDPAVSLATETVWAQLTDVAATAQLSQHCDVITFENEFVDLSALSNLAQQGVCFRPSLQSLAPLLDKYDQLCYLKNLGLPTPNFAALSPETLSLPQPFNYPVVIKVRRHGYDGQGTFILKNPTEWKTIRQQFNDIPILVQEFIPFERELAIIAARSVTGEVVTYPVVETYQKEQVCRTVIAPARLNSNLTTKIESMAQTLLNSLQAVGVFGIELFLTSNEQVYVNEIAPRTHNSGHFTLDACETSQFEQHLRAVCGFPLGSPALKTGGAVMVNLLGYEYRQHDYADKQQQLAQIPQATVHWYGKRQSRPGRKLGHVTVLLSSESEVERHHNADVISQQIESIWYGIELKSASHLVKS